jgi:hypothetical protein
MSTKGRLLLLLPLCLVLVFGCKRGNPNAPAKISGKVLYKGDPVPGGTVTFNPTGEGPGYTAAIAPDGSYHATDLPTGEFVVTIDNEFMNPEHKMKEYRGAKDKGQVMSPAPQGKNKAGEGTYIKLPPKYTDKKTSPFHETINKGEQTKNFELTD